MPRVTQLGRGGAGALSQDCLILWQGLTVVIGSTGQGNQLGGHGMVQGELMVAWAKEMCWRR